MFGGLSFFLAAQGLAALGGLLAWGIRRLAASGLAPVSPRAELRLHYLLLALFAVALAAPKPAATGELPALAHVELARVAGQAGAVSPQPAGPVVRLSTHRAPVPLDLLGGVALALTLLGAAFTLRDYLRLRARLRAACVVRRIGRVRVAVESGSGSPWSALGVGAAWVVLPESSLSDPASFRIAVAHELQHHRAGDTAGCHAMAALRTLCFFHPLRALWAAVVAEAQELACDEFLVSQRKRIGAGAYARCLLRAAEMAGREGHGRANAAAPALFSDRRLLARRIESMYVKRKNSRVAVVALVIAAGSALAVGASASNRWVIDSRVSSEKMAAMAEAARRGTDFPIAVNDEVLRELNRYLGTAKGREFTEAALARFERLRPKLERAFAGRRVPEELFAVGFVESGFENLPAQANPKAHGAGVWQFIPQSARNYGLRVDAAVDERLDVDLETDAALRYLSANQLRFGDWLLGTMAYNMGEQALNTAIQKAGTRDPWKLVRLGYENDHAYLARVMAAVLILKNGRSSL